MPRSAWMVSWPGLTPWLAMESASERLGQLGPLGPGQHPADDVAAEDVDHDVEVEVVPFLRAQQFRDVPAPALVRGSGDQLGLLGGRVGGLAAAFAHLGVGPQHPVHGGGAGQVGPLVQQVWRTRWRGPRRRGRGGAAPPARPALCLGQRPRLRLASGAPAAPEQGSGGGGGNSGPCGSPTAAQAALVPTSGARVVMAMSVISSRRSLRRCRWRAAPTAPRVFPGPR